MPESMPDHEVLITLQTQVQYQQHQLDALEDHERATLVTVARLEEHIHALKESHTQIQAALATLERKQDEYREHTVRQLTDLDHKIASGNLDLRDHFDAKIDDWQAALDNRLQAEKEALPQWAKVRLMKWSVAVAIIAIGVSILEVTHVL